MQIVAESEAASSWTLLHPLSSKPLQAASRAYPDLGYDCLWPQVSAVVQELVGGAMAATDAAAAAAVAADLEAARAVEMATGRKHLAEHKRQRKRQRDRCSHHKRANKRKNVRRSEGRKARALTRAQMMRVMSQLLLHLGRSWQASEAIEPKLNKKARPLLTYDADLYLYLYTCTPVPVHMCY